MSGPDLFPRPRDASLGEPVPVREPVERQDPSLPAEGYQLSVTADGIDLRHADGNGLRYGRQTLEQLRTDDGMWSAEITDHPDLAVRGHMLDISRDRVPTRDTLELIVERLAAARYNHLQLYTEHTFAYRDHQVVWADASPMTADDMRWLDDLCLAHGIELAANQNTFGHWERWLRHDEYRGRAECPDGMELMGRSRPAMALAPTPENADLVVGLVRELLETVRSRRVNIGCDEIFELGRGASADAVAARGKTAVFVEHLRRIAEPLLVDGYEVQFWADMVETDLDVGRPLADAGGIATVWGYEAPMDVDPDTVDLSGLPEDIREMAEEYLRTAGRGFGPRLEAFSASGFRTWVAPGTSGWNSFVGRHRNARANILDAVDAAIAHGAEGMLNTEWGDNGHMQPPFATSPALAYGGAAAWCRATNGDLTDDELAVSVSRHLLGDATGNLARAQIELGLVGETLGMGQLNGTAFFYNWIETMGFDAPAETPPEGAVDAALAQIDEAVAMLELAAPASRDGEQLLAETRFSADLVRHGLHRLAGSPDSAETDRLRAEHERHWLARARPGGLPDSLNRMR